MVKSHLVQEKQPFERIEVSRAEALEMFAENKFKATFLAPVLFVSFLYIVLLHMLNIYDLCSFLQKNELYVQVEIINELPEDKTITVYRCGPLVDLCRGPHIPNTSFVKAFACLKVMILWLCTILLVLFLVELAISYVYTHVNIQASSSYWRGKVDRESLQRVYGISFPDSRRLTV